MPTGKRSLAGMSTPSTKGCVLLGFVSDKQRNIYPPVFFLLLLEVPAVFLSVQVMAPVRPPCGLGMMYLHHMPVHRVKKEALCKMQVN